MQRPFEPNRSSGQLVSVEHDDVQMRSESAVIVRHCVAAGQSALTTHGS
jgi:hypothetical protein